MFQPNEIYTKYIYPKNFSISAGWQYSIASIDNNTSKKKNFFSCELVNPSTRARYTREDLQRIGSSWLHSNVFGKSTRTPKNPPNRRRSSCHLLPEIESTFFFGLGILERGGTAPTTLECCPVLTKANCNFSRLLT